MTKPNLSSRDVVFDVVTQTNKKYQFCRDIKCVEYDLVDTDTITVTSHGRQGISPATRLFLQQLVRTNNKPYSPLLATCDKNTYFSCGFPRKWTVFKAERFSISSYEIFISKAMISINIHILFMSALFKTAFISDQFSNCHQYMNDL